MWKKLTVTTPSLPNKDDLEFIREYEWLDDIVSRLWKYNFKLEDLRFSLDPLDNCIVERLVDDNTVLQTQDEGGILIINIGSKPMTINFHEKEGFVWENIMQRDLAVINSEDPLPIIESVDLTPGESVVFNSTLPHSYAHAEWYLMVTWSKPFKTVLASLRPWIKRSTS